MQEHTWKLIETVAEQTARKILIQFPLVHGVELEIQKPEAPIGLPFQTVSVKICRSWHKAYLALGSNMGDKEGYIRQALQSMDANPEIRVGKCSTLIRTAPYGGVEQDDFLNGAVEIETLLPPLELLEELHRLEQNANRERKIHWGPRTLDLDILLYDNDIISVEQLMVPHPDMLNRTFVLEPMAEIAPCLRHPLEGKTMVQLLKELKERTECGA
jgi:dihydroneopterin aldolase/2-amino-4-hydroxy-6-hydroxymethyldihydropteridine diphosphokinase